MLVCRHLRQLVPPARGAAHLQRLTTAAETTTTAAHEPHSELPPPPASQDGSPGATPALPNSTPTPPRRARRPPPIFIRGGRLLTAAPRTWCRPLAPGVLPAYDEALRVLRADAGALRREAGALRGALAALERRAGSAAAGGHAPGSSAAGGAAAAAAAAAAVAPDPRAAQDPEALRARLEKLELEAETNLPSVRWAVAQGMADMSRPVHRHLVEQKWRSDGALDLLMERLHQMHVIPDVVPTLHPGLDLRVAVRKPPAHLHRGTRRTRVLVEPGQFLLPEQTLQPPTLKVTVFHTDTRLYTLLMVDPDVPDEATRSYKTYLHWLHPNIPLSAHSPNGPIPLLPTAPAPTDTGTDTGTPTPYVPPHPQRGSGPHRYAILLLPHGVGSGVGVGDGAGAPLAVPRVPDAARLGFDVRAFVARWGLRLGERGGGSGGACMWRSEWSTEVARVYRDVLKQEEPRYGRMPRYDPYEELKKRQRYP